MLGLTGDDIAIGNGNRRLVATGQKSRDYLNAAAKDELDANADTVCKSGLAPLRETEQIRRAKQASTTAGTGTSETKANASPPDTLSIHLR
jgi:hypothetical protein